MSSASVNVAVIDSGVDGSHPELAGRIAAARSFVPGSPLVDQDGHGTFVAGLIAAQDNDGVGIAGLAPSAAITDATVASAEGGSENITAAIAATPPRASGMRVRRGDLDMRIPFQGRRPGPR